MENINKKELYNQAKKRLHTYKLIDTLDYIYHQRQHAIYKQQWKLVDLINNLGQTVSEMMMQDDYRKSLHWKDVSNRTKTLYPKCTTCKRDVECVHHNQYHGVLFVEKPGIDIVSMCYNCHEIYHQYRTVISGTEIIEELKRVN